MFDSPGRSRGVSEPAGIDFGTDRGFPVNGTTLPPGLPKPEMKRPLSPPEGPRKGLPGPF